MTLHQSEGARQVHRFILAGSDPPVDGLGLGETLVGRRVQPAPHAQQTLQLDGGGLAAGMSGRPLGGHGGIRRTVRLLLAPQFPQAVGELEVQSTRHTGTGPVVVGTPGGDPQRGQHLVPVPGLQLERPQGPGQPQRGVDVLVLPGHGYGPDDVAHLRRQHRHALRLVTARHPALRCRLGAPALRQRGVCRMQHTVQQGVEDTCYGSGALGDAVFRARGVRQVAADLGAETVAAVRQRLQQLDVHRFGEHPGGLRDLDARGGRGEVGVDRRPAAEGRQPAEPCRLRPEPLTGASRRIAYRVVVPRRLGHRIGGGGPLGQQAERGGPEGERVAGAPGQQCRQLPLDPRDLLPAGHLPQHLHRVAVAHRRYGDRERVQGEGPAGHHDQQEDVRGGRDETADLGDRRRVVDHDQHPAPRGEPPVQLLPGRPRRGNPVVLDAHLPEEVLEDRGRLRSVLTGGVTEVDVELPVGEAGVEQRAHVEGDGGRPDARRPRKLRAARPPRGGTGRFTLQPLHGTLAIGEVAGRGRQGARGQRDSLLNGSAPQERRPLGRPPRIVADPGVHLARQRLQPVDAGRQGCLPPQCSARERPRGEEQLLAHLTGGAVPHRGQKRGERAERHDLQHVGPSP